MSSTVDTAGRFELRSVPSGDVQLQFSGTGVNARITITGVGNGEQIRIVVTIIGSTASLENVERVGQDNRIEVEGTISAGSCASFTLNGMTVTTNNATVFEHGTCADIRPGRRVEVKGTRQTNGTVLASRIEFEDQVNNQVELEGTISAGSCASFTLNGVTVTTTGATVFEHGTCADIRPGRRVEVKGTRQTNGTVLASRIEFEDQVNNQVELEGTISAGSCGSFTLNGVTVTTNSATVFEDGACADIRPGRRVEVKGTRQANGTVLASRVEFEDEVNNQVELEGTISAGSCGSFTLNGMTVTTNSSTRFDHGTCADIRPGRRVEVKGTRQGTGSVLATRVEFE